MHRNDSGNLLKSDSAAATSAVPFQFDDVQKLAKKILASANAQAQRTLAAAREQAKEFEKTAFADGEEKGFAAGHEKGRAEGRAEGTESARKEVFDAAEGLAGSLREMLALLNEERARLQNDAETDLLALALALAGRIVKREVALDDEIALRACREAVRLTVERRDILLRVHPDDLAAVEDYLPELRSAFTDLERVGVEADEAVERGGARATTREGEVDLRIGEQFRALERALLGQDDEAASHPGEDGNAPNAQDREDSA
jgi:flagellar assembly protein FliH